MLRLVVIFEGFLTPEINAREKIGMKVRVITTRLEGSITASFGKAGKSKVSFPDGISPALLGTKVELIE